MGFELRQFPNLNSRFIYHDERKFELWSPNSTQTPFYPGRRSSTFLPSDPIPSPQRRYDGHAGKHDCLYVPQYARKDTMHWPFMRRIPAVGPEDPRLPMFAPFTDQWETRGVGGGLRLAFVNRLSTINGELENQMLVLRPQLSPLSGTWDSRPKFPMEVHIRALLNLRVWEAAVDQGVAVQRGLREKEAWIEYLTIRFHQRASGLDLPQLLRLEMQPAKEEFMGVWVNGCSEETVLRFMAAQIPCFIIHESQGGWEPVPPNTCIGFLTGTDISVLLSDLSPYQHIARQQGLLDNLVKVEDGRGERVQHSATTERKSSSRFLVHLPPRVLPALPPRPSAQAAPPPPAGPSAAPALSLDSSVPSSSMGENVIPSAPSAATNKYAAPELVTHIVAKDRVPWIVPPTVVMGADRGTWEKYLLTDLDGVRTWVYQGKNKSVSAKNVWYDRNRRRQLHFGSFTPPAGIVDWQRFGSYVPRFPFVHPGNGHISIPQKASHWMYPTMAPTAAERGSEPQEPHPNQLPRLHDVRGQQRIWRDKNGRELQPPSDGEDDEEAGMDVDEPTAAETPSNVLTPRGLADDLTSIMFMTLAEDRFLAHRVNPVAVMRAQGMIWVRFTSAQEGERARGILATLDYGIEISYMPDSEFDDAAQYTTDVWTESMIQEEVDNAPPPSANPSSQTITSSSTAATTVDPPASLSVALSTPNVSAPPATPAISQVNAAEAVVPAPHASPSNEGAATTTPAGVIAPPETEERREHLSGEPSSAKGKGKAPVRQEKPASKGENSMTEEMGRINLQNLPIPTGPRAWQESRESVVAGKQKVSALNLPKPSRPTLEARLRDPPKPPVLASRIGGTSTYRTPSPELRDAQSLIPFPLRISDPPIAGPSQRRQHHLPPTDDRPPAKRTRLNEPPDAPEWTPPPDKPTGGTGVKKKARRGKHSGKLVKQYEQWLAEREEASQVETVEAEEQIRRWRSQL
ncbi:hypothetical protein B0H10DRAFT_2223729 [Mycena sp. CBHHK59/15]|nr:hypothetical protein B0H10DRAFT_2223729 [Mycena sp. CBHHK59/15]